MPHLDSYQANKDRHVRRGKELQILDTTAIVKAIETCSLSSHYCGSGELVPSDLGITIEGVGSVKLPLAPVTKKKLNAIARQAPYGRQTKTIVDTKVRNTLEIDGKQVTFSESFQTAIDHAVDQMAQELELERERVEIDLYKLLIYDKGCFFLPHRDTEKSPGMVATLVVILPNRFRGGHLRIEHAGESELFEFELASNQKSAEWVAFYADCQHEIELVEAGNRLCLTFNVKLRPQASVATKQSFAGDAALFEAVKSWFTTRPESPMVFALDHRYTNAGLAASLLKGSDAKLCKELVMIADALDGVLHFGQVSRHLVQYADDGDYKSRNYISWSSEEGVKPPEISHLTIGEAFDDELVIDGWKLPSGGAVRKFAPLSCNAIEQLISSSPINQWTPTQIEYEGYTGNAGNTIDRWYHRSAIVLWPRTHHFDVMIDMGLEPVIDELEKRMTKADVGTEKSKAKVAEECRQIASSIVRSISTLNLWDSDSPRVRSMESFSAKLPSYADLKLFNDLLQRVAVNNTAMDLSQCVLEALRRFTAPEILPALDSLMLHQFDGRWSQTRKTQSSRNAQLLIAICSDPNAREQIGITKITTYLMAALSTLEESVQLSDSDTWSASRFEYGTWLHLCQAACLLQSDLAIEKLLKMPLEFPRAFEIRKVQVEAAIKLHQWILSKNLKCPEPIKQWIRRIRNELREATRARPKPYSGFERPAPLPCKCSVCLELSAFLLDRNQERGRIAARQDLRDHLEREISIHQIDVTTRLDRSRSPHALLLTKTNESYKRLLDQYQADLKLHLSLPKK